MYTIVCVDPTSFRRIVWCDIPLTAVYELARIILAEIKPGYLYIISQELLRPAMVAKNKGL
jgi:hypothetical protein